MAATAVGIPTFQHVIAGAWVASDSGQTFENGHHEAGHAALDTFSEWKAIDIDVAGRLQRAQIDNQPA